MKKVLKEIDRRYVSRTPAILKRLGGALSVISATITGYAIHDRVEWLGYLALGTGVIGQLLIHLFEEEK